jgi:hypothetical protein
MSAPSTRARAARSWIAAAALAAASFAGAALAQDAGALKARHASLSAQLGASPFQRPLVLESTQNSGDLKGEVYAVVEHPFSLVGPALQGMEHWCELLMVHLNVKSCSASTKPPDVLSLFVGRKVEQTLEEAHRVDFKYTIGASTPDYLHVRLSADAGPMSTRDYRIALEAVPLDAKRSFLHMSYSYGYGMAARLAMQGYLATIGRDKVGFSIVGKDGDGKPTYVDNVRGVVERNTMRYFLAIEAFLNAYTLPAAEQSEQRLRDWFAATERYPLQLHEIERTDYLEMKHREIARRKSGAPR